MLVHNPDEQIRRNTVNDGGQRYPNNGGEVPTLEALLSRDCKTADVLAHEIGPDKTRPDYSYLKGDLTLAYSNKIKKFHRSFVFLDLKDKQHPAALIVYDIVSSADKNFSKYWLMHCVEEPDIQGIRTTVVRGEKGYNGKLVNSTLLPGPENLTINKVGGKGMEFPVFGKNFPQYYNNDRNAWDGAIWRIEVMPKKAAITDNFLNVMQVMDYKNGPAPLTVRNVQSDKMVGAMIADRVVLFSRTSDRQGEKITVTLEGKDKLKVLVTDLQPGIWQVGRSGQSAKDKFNVTDGGNSLYFEATGGEYTLTRSGNTRN